ncbi:ferredoxin [Methyloferula stellata]|uniref:ferredoxin n=1 Tax=Methyloferula stellata TaxID=876270 RepID=UPI000379AADE|nr:ferredoxin [Methyloferula stellata]
MAGKSTKRADRAATSKVKVNPARCQGHARCTAVAPELFELDEFGSSREKGDGIVPAGLEHKARLAKANCPEFAIEIMEE